MKIAIVTGSSKGIGRAIALAFARSKGYSGIVINGRRVDEAQEVADQIENEGCDSLVIEADISYENDCVRLIEEAYRAFGRIDVLVNNAGIQSDIPFEETTTREWYKIIGVDLTAPFTCSREAAKHMEKQHPKGGCIINISSVPSNNTKAPLHPLCYLKGRPRNDDKNYGIRIGQIQYKSKFGGPRCDTN